MSYCRWSSCDFGCDLYIYEHVGGYWNTSVASHRVIGDVPHLPPLTAESTSDGSWHRAYRAQMDFLKTARREPIGLPHDGEHFCDDSIEECIATFDRLRAMGYRAPDYAREMLVSESEELATKAKGE